MRSPMPIALLVALSTLALVAAGCGGGGSGSGVITADRSSTVGPFTTKAAEDFKASGGADVTAEARGARDSGLEVRCEFSEP